MKINSPKKLAFLSALFSSLIMTTCVLLLEPVSLSFVSKVLLISAGTFVLIYFLIYFMIEKFLYGKIKLIYKNITSMKAQKNNDVKINMGEDVLGAVSEEVKNWADNKGEEIQALKEQEIFRKQFIGNLAHELKTPVFSIQGYILTLLEGGLEDPKVNREFLLRASKGVDRMTHIIEDLDVIIKMESGRIPMKLKKSNIVETVKDCIESLERKAKKQKVKIKLKENEEKVINVLIDNAKIGQVISNLLINAINYSKEEGGNVEIRFYDMNENILVEVADDGLGMAEEHLPRLFERFYRVDKSRSRNQGGTGLGLAIVKHIIEGHGQTINVRSTEGIGSTFSFTLKKA